MNKYFEEALTEAYKGINSKEGGPFGAVVVKDGVIIGKGHNTVLKDIDCTAHAEMNAIRNASKEIKNFDLSECEVYTTSQPCPMCLSACYWANISKIYYLTSSSDIEKYGWDDRYIYSQMFKHSLKRLNLFGKSKLERKSIDIKKIEDEKGIKLFEDWKALGIPKY